MRKMNSRIAPGCMGVPGTFLGGLEVAIYGQVSTWYPQMIWYGRKYRHVEIMFRLVVAYLVPINTSGPWLVVDKCAHM